MRDWGAGSLYDYLFKFLIFVFVGLSVVYLSKGDDAAAISSLNTALLLALIDVEVIKATVGYEQ